MQPVPRAVCIGEGLVVLVARDPGPLEQSAVFDRSAGGAEVNVAGVLAGLGVSSAWASRVGNDGFGRYLVSSVAGRGIDVSAVQTDSARRTGIYIKERGGSTADANDLGSGNSRMHYYRQASAASAMDVAFLETPPVAGLLATSELVHVTGITPALSSSATACTLALAARPRATALVSFDLNYRPALWADRLDQAPLILADIMRQVDVAFLGADEADAVWGIDDPDQLRRMFAGPRHLIVKNGGGRVTVFDGPVRADIAALQVDVVEQIGAGDAFAGGFLAGLLTGLGVRERARLGHLCAAAVLTSHSDNVPVDWNDDVSLALRCDQRAWSSLRVGAGGLPATLAALRAPGRVSVQVGLEAGQG